MSTCVMTMGVDALAAQSSEPGAPVRVSVQSVFDTISATGGAAPQAQGLSRFAADLSHQRGTRRGPIRLWGAASADRSWTEADQQFTAAIAAESDITLTRRMHLSFSDRASAAPVDVFAALGSAPAAESFRPVTNGTELQATRAIENRAAISLTRTVSALTDIAFSGTGLFSNAAGARVTAAGAGGRMTRHVGRFAAWYVGYGLSEAHTHDGTRGVDQRRHDIDVGVDYSRPLSVWRNTTLRVATGTTVLAQDNERRARLSVAARIGHRFAAQWSGSLDYSRPIEYVVGLVEPLIADAVNITLTGMLPRRIAVSATAGAAAGTVGLNSAARYQSYTASLRCMRRIVPGVDAAFEIYDAAYKSSGLLGHGSLPEAFGRRGIRAGLTWAPGQRAAHNGGARAARP
jgi:hypothetical protein